jgi:hypothetical protein
VIGRPFAPAVDVSSLRIEEGGRCTIFMRVVTPGARDPVVAYR